MISRIKGTVIDKKLKSIEVMISSGLSFELYTPNSFLFVPEKEYTFFTIMLFAVDKGYSLYGFVDEKTKNFFKILQECRGIGPKLALTIVEMLSIKDFYTAVTLEKKELLHNIPGIGKKKAELIIIELKPKVLLFESLLSHDEVKETSPEGRVIGQDLEEALIKIGFQKTEAKKMVSKVFEEKNPQNHSIEELLVHALGCSF